MEKPNSWQMHKDLYKLSKMFIKKILQDKFRQIEQLRKIIDDKNKRINQLEEQNYMLGIRLSKIELSLNTKISQNNRKQRLLDIMQVSSWMELQKFNILLLNSKELEVVPEQIGNLSNLKRVDLSNNRIRKLPQTLSQLSHLKQLNISQNMLVQLPQFLTALTQLQYFYFHENPLKKMPNFLVKFKNLKYISLGLSILPSNYLKCTELCNLKNLQIYITFKAISEYARVQIQKQGILNNINVHFQKL